MGANAEANTVVFTAKDGHKLALPLDWALEHGAVVATRINGDMLSEVIGSSNQLWMAGVPAKYFIRDIVSIDFLNLEEPPAPPSFEPTDRDFVNRPNVAVKGPYLCSVGDEITFEGWADDYDKRIVAVEVSLNGGASWTVLETPGTDAARMLTWRFVYTPKAPGTYLLQARAVNEDGKKSPICAEHCFQAS